MSERILTFDEVVSLMQALGLSAEMIAIDGAPLAESPRLPNGSSPSSALG